MVTDAYFDTGLFDDSLFDNTTPPPYIPYPPTRIDIDSSDYTTNLINSVHNKIIVLSDFKDSNIHSKRLSTSDDSKRTITVTTSVRKKTIENEE
jgi:hypothetical protein